MPADDEDIIFLNGKVSHSHWCKYLAEFVGTYFLVLTVGCCVLTGSIGAAISIGSVLMVMIYSLGSVSGAHFNPAVTVAILLSSRRIIEWTDALAYIVAQLLGGLCAGASYLGLFGMAFTLEPVGHHSAWAAATVEVVYTMALCYVVLNVATTQKQDGNNYFGLAIGFTVVSAALAIGGLSGCCLNPAVALGTMVAQAVINGVSSMTYFPLYFFCPYIGSVVACLAFYGVQKADEYRSD
jgi:aquaporin Z